MTEEKKNYIHASIHASDKDIGVEKNEKKKEAEKKEKGGWIKKVLDKKKD